MKEDDKHLNFRSSILKDASKHKEAFHSQGKKAPVLASLVRYFLPCALDKYSVLRWQGFRKKEKMFFWWGICFVILLSAFVRTVGKLHPSNRYTASFCNSS